MGLGLQLCTIAIIVLAALCSDLKNSISVNLTILTASSEMRAVQTQTESFRALATPDSLAQA